MYWNRKDSIGIFCFAIFVFCSKRLILGAFLYLFRFHNRIDNIFLSKIVVLACWMWWSCSNNLSLKRPCGIFSTLFERRCCTKVPKVGFSWGRGNKIGWSPAYSIAQGGKFVVCCQLWGFVSFWIVWRLTCTRFHFFETTIAEKNIN